MPFEQYIEEQKQWVQNQPKKEMVKFVPKSSVTFNRSIFMQTINNINTMNDVDLRKFIDMNFRTILDNIFFGDQQRYLQCFTDIRFMQAFNDVIGNMKYFDRADAIKLNTIAYHYLTLPVAHRDAKIANAMNTMANTVNRSKLPRLLGLGLSNNLATMLLIARYSDRSIDICVKRVDFIIITQPKELMTENMINEILRILYDVFNIFPAVFQATMYDVMPDYDENNPNTMWITEDIQEIDSTLNLVILDILENLPTNTIRDTLMQYAEAYQLINSNKRIRFSMQKLSNDYFRINDVVYKLKTLDGIIVP